MSKYDYEMLRAAATAPGATQEDINKLGEWFEQYGDMYWNGESFDADDELQVVRIYKPVEGSPGEFEIVGYELR